MNIDSGINTSRIAYIDICKGIGIVLMVLSHVGLIGRIGAGINWIIHSFHMPLFFFVSGFLYKSTMNNSIIDFLKKKTISLLVPYFSFAILYFCISNFLYSYVNLVNLKAIFWINTTDELPIANALWFLTSFYISLVIYEILNRTISNKYFLSLLVFLISLLGGYKKT